MLDRLFPSLFAAAGWPCLLPFFRSPRPFAGTLQYIKQHTSKKFVDLGARIFLFFFVVQGTIVLDGIPPAAVASLQEVGYLPVELAFSLGPDTMSGVDA